MPVGHTDEIDLRQRGRPFLLLYLSPPTQGILNLAEPGRRCRGPFCRPPSCTEGIIDLAELRGGQHACQLDQIVPVQGGQPGARGNARPGEPEPQYAFKRQSFQDADCHLDSQARDVGIRRSDDLHRPEAGWLFSRQQDDRPSLVELDPPDLAAPHVSSWPGGPQVFGAGHVLRSPGRGRHTQWSHLRGRSGRTPRSRA
jgi:hypothetical protein